MYFKKIKEKLHFWARINAQGPYATPSLLLLAFAESVFFPIPVDVLLIPLVILRAKGWKYYALVATIASVLGGIVGYALGFFLFSLVGERIVALYHFEPEFALVSEWLSNNTFWATFISAFTPIPYKVFTLSAGLLHAPFFVFLLASLFGRFLRYMTVSLIAYIWGAQFVRIVLRSFSTATFFVFFAVIFTYILIKMFFKV